MEDELSNYLAELAPEGPWRVDAVLKSGSLETTQRVYFVGCDGSGLGPFVRKRLSASAGLGGAYETVFAAQQRGVRLAHVPRILSCERSGDELVVVMEHVAGTTLAEVVRAADTSQRPALAARVFPELCDAVAELSDRFGPPLVHRDLKPSNVMVSEGGITLIDLGIARAYKEGAERDTTRFGTRAYAPPEQFGFGQTSVASDVYALGMLLFFCLTGCEPTARDREAGFAGTGLPDAVRAIVVRATQLDPAARYAGPRELRDAFLATLSAASIEKPGGPVAEKPARSATEKLVRPATVPEEPPTFERDRRLGPRVAGLLARVPEGVGVAWDVCVLLVLAVFLIGCVMAIVEPTPENAKWPQWYLVYSYACFMMPLCTLSSALILDRRPLRRLFPALRCYTLRQEVRAEVMGLIVVGVLWLVVTMVVRP